jgi:hypothetical protein
MQSQMMPLGAVAIGNHRRPLGTRHCDQSSRKDSVCPATAAGDLQVLVLVLVLVLLLVLVLVR